MNISSAKFIKGLVESSEILEDCLPHIAFIGRSNVGKSSIINSLTHQKDLARTSSFPGRTQELNLFLINKSFYFVDIPGYGYAKSSAQMRERLWNLIDWYLFQSPYKKRKILLIIDANVGPTHYDVEMLQMLEEKAENIIIVANKIDKIKPSSYSARQLQKIRAIVGEHIIIPYSSKKKIGIQELLKEIFK